MKGVQGTCCMCTSPINDNSVHFLCNCLVTLCKECAFDQISRNRSTFRSHIVCPVCGSQECNSSNLVIDGIDKAESVERELIKQACSFFKESKPQSFQKKVQKLIPLYRKLIVLFSELGYPCLKSPFVSGTSRDDIHVLGLHVARCEAHRQEIQREHKTDTFIPLETRLSFALGPLEKIIIKPNFTLEKILDFVTGRDREANRMQLSCATCFENFETGNTVRMLCSCFTYNCQLCQRRIMKNYKDTFRKSPAKCMHCNSPSIPFNNIEAARDLENMLLKQHPQFKSSASVSTLYFVYTEIADLCKMDRAIAFHDFIDQNQAEWGRGSNNYCSKAMCFLEMARMEVERTRRQFYQVPLEERSDVSNLPLGPLARLHIRRNVFLEAFLNFIHGIDVSAAAESVTDLVDYHTMKDPEALFDETTNRLREKDGPGGELSAQAVLQIQQEVANRTDETFNRTFSHLLRTESAPCRHPNCAFNAYCPVYLEQHMHAIHIQHLDEVDAIAPRKRVSRKAAQAAQAAMRAGNVVNLEDAEEDDLNRALAESLRSAHPSAPKRVHTTEPEFRDGHEEDESDEDVELLVESRVTRAQRQQTASNESIASQSRVDDGDDSECEFMEELPRAPTRTRVERELPEPVLDRNQAAELRELLGDDHDPGKQKVKKILPSTSKHTKHSRHLQHALLPSTTVQASSESDLESASEEERQDVHRKDSTSASTSSSAQNTASSTRTLEVFSVHEAPLHSEPAPHRIKKRKTAYSEDNDDNDSNVSIRSHQSQTAVPTKEKRHKVVVPPSSRSSKPVPDGAAQAKQSAPPSAGFNLASAMAAASSAAAAVEPPRKAHVDPPTPPALTESGRDLAPAATNSMQARERRREVLLEANKARLQEEERSKMLQEPQDSCSSDRNRPDKRVRFAPVVECQEFVISARESQPKVPEVVELDPQMPREVHKVPEVIDFFSIVDRLKNSQIIPPPLPPTPPPPVSLSAAHPVQFIASRPAPPPVPPEPSDDEDDEEEGEVAEDSGAPLAPPQLPYVQLQRLKIEPVTSTSSATATTASPYAFSVTPGTSAEEYQRQSQARYYHQAYRSEANDESRALNAKPFSMPGLPYAEDMNRFSGAVLQDPTEAWRSGEAYVDLHRPSERRYELVFDVDKPRTINAVELLAVRAKFMLRFPDGSLKKMAESTPCKEVGYSQVEIKMETMQAELVAVLKLIALPRFGFRGKITQWSTTRDTLLQAKGTFHKYGIMPDTFITLRDLSRPAPGFMDEERVRNPPPNPKVSEPAAQGPYWRKPRNRLSNADFALQAEEKKRLRREQEARAASMELIKEQHPGMQFSELSGSVSSQSPRGSASTGSSEMIHARLNRFGEPMLPRIAHNTVNTSEDSMGSPGSAHGESTGSSGKGFPATPPPATSTPSVSTTSPDTSLTGRRDQSPSLNSPPESGATNADTESDDDENPTYLSASVSAAARTPDVLPLLDSSVASEGPMVVDCGDGRSCGTPEDNPMTAQSSDSPPLQTEHEPQIQLLAPPSSLTDLGESGEVVLIEISSDSEPDGEAWSLSATIARVKRAAAASASLSAAPANTATTMETAIVLGEDESDEEPVEWSLSSIARGRVPPASPPAAQVSVPPQRTPEAEAVCESASAAVTVDITTPTAAVDAAVAVANVVSPPPSVTPLAATASTTTTTTTTTAANVKKRSRFDDADSLFTCVEATTTSGKRARTGDANLATTTSVVSKVSSGSEPDRGGRDRAAVASSSEVSLPTHQSSRYAPPPSVNQPLTVRPIEPRNSGSGRFDGGNVAVTSSWPGAPQPPLKKSTSRFGGPVEEYDPRPTEGPWVKPPALAKSADRFGVNNFTYNSMDDNSDSSENWEGPNKRKHGRRKAKLHPREQTAGSTNSTGISNKKPPIYFDTSVRFAKPRSPPVAGVNVASAGGMSAVNLEALSASTRNPPSASTGSYYGPAPAEEPHYSSSDRNPSRDRSDPRGRDQSPEYRGRGQERSPDSERGRYTRDTSPRGRRRSPSPSRSVSASSTARQTSPYEPSIGWALDRRSAPVQTLPLTQSSLNRQLNLAPSEVNYSLEQRQAICSAILGTAVNLPALATLPTRSNARPDVSERDIYGPGDGGGESRGYYIDRRR